MLHLPAEAKLRYRANEYDVLSPGDHVRCAVSGQRIPLARLRYWNVELQEAYADAYVANRRYQQLREAKA